MYDKYVIDGTFGRPTPNSFCFCPVDGDSVIVGLALITTKPDDGKVIGVYHSDGELAKDNFYNKYKKDIDAIIEDWGEE